MIVEQIMFLQAFVFLTLSSILFRISYKGLI